LKFSDGVRCVRHTQPIYVTFDDVSDSGTGSAEQNRADIAFDSAFPEEGSWSTALLTRLHMNKINIVYGLDCTVCYIVYMCNPV
jgi:hypothetical protein